MKQPLVITEQRWLPKLVDVVLTLLAWGLFAYLFFTGFIAVIQQRVVPEAHLHFGLLFATIQTLLVYLLVGLINAAILVGWAKYNQFRRRGGERRNRKPVLDDKQLLRSFDVSAELLDVLRNNQIVTVFNDEHGRISYLAAGSAGSQWTGSHARAKHQSIARDSAAAPLSGDGPVHEAAVRAEPSYRP